MISLQEFNEKIRNYEDGNADPVTALAIVTNEGTVKVHNDMLYLVLKEDIAFNDITQGDFSDYWDDSESLRCQAFATYFYISTICRTIEDENNSDSVIALLLLFDDIFGYDTEYGSGMAAIKYEDIRKQHEITRSVFGGPSFEEIIRKKFKEKADTLINAFENVATEEEWLLFEKSHDDIRNHSYYNKKIAEYRKVAKTLEDIKKIKIEDITEDNWDQYVKTFNTFMKIENDRRIEFALKPYWQHIAKLEKSYADKHI